MLVYRASKQNFLDDIRSNSIEDIIENEVKRKLRKNSPKAEILSWKNSLQYMAMVLIDPEIPALSWVAIEYNIPLTSNRIDFILTGKDPQRNDTAVIIELKQWQNVQTTNKDAIVKTLLGGGIRETNHPSYQAWSYASLIEDYNETVRFEKIRLQPCAYLHNMKAGQPINDLFYQAHTAKAPVFISPDAMRLAEFLKQFVKYGDSDDIMYRIENGAIRPSKNLADSLASMIKGNEEFLMIDGQKNVYETALDLAHQTERRGKQTLIVKGGPGTGKSVVAINLLVELTKREKVTQYVSKNAAPRAVFAALLTGTKTKTQFNNLFKGSGSHLDTATDKLDAVLIDEAHRLNEKSGLYGNLGDNQIKELINASKLSVFFIDEAQRVTLKDIGSVATIRQWAEQLGSEVTELNLDSQFRCNGSDGYLAWIDQALQIRDTANMDLDGIDYEVKVFDDPNHLRRAIEEKNRANNKARLVAGYCWDWKSKKDSLAMDIVIPEHNFSAQWNLDQDGSLWIIAAESVKQIGCIHTCQGLEVDYIGVIIGDDFVIRDGQVVTDATKRSANDRSIRGIKKQLKEAPLEAKRAAAEVIKNTYRTLMTRGQKGCYLYCTDPETLQYFQLIAQRPESDLNSYTDQPHRAEIPFELFTAAQIKPYRGYVPLFDLQAAAGDFSDFQLAEEANWIKLPEYINTSEGMFVIQVVGESMNRRIPNGSWCLFKADPGGTRNGKIVLAQSRSIEDPDHGGSYTVKLYESEKATQGSELLNQKIVLKPDTSAFGYSPIRLSAESDVVIIGEFLAVL
jgi:hypothetical protein